MLREKLGTADVHLDPANIFLLHQVYKGFPGLWQYFLPFNMALVHLPLISPESVESLKNGWAAHVQPEQASKNKFGQRRRILGHYVKLCFLGCFSYPWV